MITSGPDVHRGTIAGGVRDEAAGRLFVFGGVSEGVFDKFDNVAVGQGVVDVFTVARANNDVPGAEHAESLGDGGDGFAFGFRELGDAGFALGEEGEKAEARGITDGAEEACGAFDGGGGGSGERRVGALLIHLHNCASIIVTGSPHPCQTGAYLASLDILMRGVRHSFSR